MKKLFLILLIIHSSLLIANAQWVTQFTASNNTQINTIQFVNESTGYAVGEGVSPTYGYIYKTTNGGLNWSSIILPSYMNFFLWNLYFLNSNTGFICGHSYQIFKTIDGGNNWTYIDAPLYFTQTYSVIQFFNEQTGYIAGRYGMNFKTTNGGLNWITYDTAFTDIDDIYFVDINTGYLVDTYSGVYKTTNGCISWNYKIIKDSTQYNFSLQKVKFINYNTGYIVGSRIYPSRGVLFKTTDGGNNWKSIFIIPDNSLYSLALVDSSTVYVGSYNKIIYKSSNGGVNWISQQLPTYWAVTSSIFFVNSNTGYCCAGNELMKTTNGGVNVNKISTEIPGEFKIFQNYPNPFNPVTSIKYQVPNTKYIKLAVYDILGKEITVLINERQTPGMYEVKFDASNLTSGIYFYSLFVDGKLIDAKKLILIK
jgi:photosystem II stability/assembly factor-like uncharacterized protein